MYVEQYLTLIKQIYSHSTLYVIIHFLNFQPCLLWLGWLSTLFFFRLTFIPHTLWDSSRSPRVSLQQPGVYSYQTCATTFTKLLKRAWLHHRRLPVCRRLRVPLHVTGSTLQSTTPRAPAHRRSAATGSIRSTRRPAPRSAGHRGTLWGCIYAPPLHFRWGTFPQPLHLAATVLPRRFRDTIIRPGNSMPTFESVSGQAQIIQLKRSHWRSEISMTLLRYIG